MSLNGARADWVINGGQPMFAIGQFMRNKQTLVGAA